LPTNAEEQLELLVEAEKVDADDDSYLQDLETFRKHPININTADEETLGGLKLISDLQITQLLRYRKQLGKIISIYELQAIPCWDVVTIKKILLYIFIGETKAVAGKFADRMRHGEHSFILRATQMLEPSRGYRES
jgi:DNA uptake protein ComE-like DNA-binding protein